jgi:AraC-like DNA-binding protein
MIVKEELQKLGLETEYIVVDIGTIQMMKDITEEQQHLLRESLLKSGLELLDDRKSALIEQIKEVIIELIHFTEIQPNLNYSDYISQKLNYDYTYLASLFSQVRGVTIQQFIIFHKIEKVKELLMYDKLTLTEISYKLNYSSVAHLSGQFKKVTGLSPTFFKQLKQKRHEILGDM